MELLTEKVRQWLDIRANENVAIDIPELCKLILGDADGLTRDAERYRFVRACKGVAISAKEARDPIAYDAAIDAAMLKTPNAGVTGSGEKI